MSYNTLEEADTALSYVAEWSCLSAEAKQGHLHTAGLWLDHMYTWPGKLDTAALNDASHPHQWPRTCCDGGVLTDTNGRELTGIPDAIKTAELIAARTGLTVSLFPDPSTRDKGNLKSYRRKVDVLEREYEYFEPTGNTNDPRTIGEVDVILSHIAERGGAKIGRLLLPI